MEWPLQNYRAIEMNIKISEANRISFLPHLHVLKNMLVFDVLQLFQSSKCWCEDLRTEALTLYFGLYLVDVNLELVLRGDKAEKIVFEYFQFDSQNNELKIKEWVNKHHHFKNIYYLLLVSPGKSFHVQHADLLTKD